MVDVIGIYLALSSCDGLAKAQPRGATPRPQSGAEAERTPCPKGGGQEELLHVRGQGQRLTVPDCNGAGTAKRNYPGSEARGGGGEEIPSVRGQGRRREELPHISITKSSVPNYTDIISFLKNYLYRFKCVAVGVGHSCITLKEYKLK